MCVLACVFALSAYPPKQNVEGVHSYKFIFEPSIMLNSTKMHKYLSRHGILRHKTHTETLTDTQKYRHVRIHRDKKITNTGRYT